jgi:hypothetical protein
MRDTVRPYLQPFQKADNFLPCIGLLEFFVYFRLIVSAGFLFNPCQYINQLPMYEFYSSPPVCIIAPKQDSANLS